MWITFYIGGFFMARYRRRRRYGRRGRRRRYRRAFGIRGGIRL